MIGTETEMLADAVNDCAVTGRSLTIRDSAENVVWTIEADTKVDPDDLTFPVIVHLRGGMSSDALAILTVDEEPVA